jgi:tRNA G18 (ribose-2'-O)-methylase SpoU
MLVSTTNNAFQHIEVLKRNRTRRRQCGEFFVEGVRPIQRLVDNRWTVRSIWSDRQRPLSGWAESIVLASGTEHHYRLGPGLMELLSDREEPSELLAVAEMRRQRLDALQPAGDLLLVVLDRPASPGNLGTVVRSADALGADAVLVAGHAADPYDPRAIRASMGSLFSLPVLEIDGPGELGHWLAAHPATVLGTDSGGEVSVQECDLRRPLAIVVGTEGKGLSHGFRELCDQVAHIPMLGSADSLNMAVAASIVLYEARRQRGADIRPH